MIYVGRWLAPDRGTAMLAMSAYELGYSMGALVITAVGALLVYKGYQTWSSPSGRAVTQYAPARSTIPAAAPMPATATSAPVAAPANDDFFGGTIRPATTSPPTYDSAPGPNPAVTDARWHPDYSSSGAASGGSSGGIASKNTTGLIVLIVGLLVVGVGLFQSYQAFLAPSRSIALPDRLIGMDRNESAVQLIEQAQDQMASAPGIFGEVELEGAVYTSGERVLYVMGGEKGAADPSDYDEFGAGFEEGFSAGGTDFTMAEVEAGSLGGKMWCTERPVQTASVCAWLDKDTFGVIVLAAEGADVQDSAVEIREAVVN